MKKRSCHKRKTYHFSGSGGMSSSSSASKPIAPGLIGSTAPLLQKIQTGAQNIASVSLPDSVNSDNLWALQSRYLLQGMRPGLAARGFLTSGTAQRQEDQALSDLSTNFAQDEFTRELQKAQLAQGGQTSSTQALISALQAILGQTTTGRSSGSSFNAGTSFLGG